MRERLVQPPRELGNAKADVAAREHDEERERQRPGNGRAMRVRGEVRDQRQAEQHRPNDTISSGYWSCGSRRIQTNDDLSHSARPARSPRSEIQYYTWQRTRWHCLSVPWEQRPTDGIPAFEGFASEPPSNSRHFVRISRVLQS